MLSSCGDAVIPLPTKQNLELKWPYNLELEWPYLVIEKILSKIAAAASESKEMSSLLLNCRLVCRNWNHIIEDTSEFMNQITFIVHNPQEFVNLPIVKKEKVRSIKLTKVWDLHQPEHNQKDTKNFIDAISNIVEKVHFAFEQRDILDSEFEKFDLFKLILMNCPRLQELIVDETNTDEMVVPHQLLWQITDQIEILAANKIHSFVVNMVGFTEDDFFGLTTLLLKLPQLNEIKLVGTCAFVWHSLIYIYNGLIRYLDKYKNRLQLKKLLLPLPAKDLTMVMDDHNEDFIEENETLNSLLILCGKNSIVIEGVIHFMDLNLLMQRPEISEMALASSSYQQQRQSPLFKGKVKARFNFDGSAFPNLDLLGELDIQKLKLGFKSDISQGQFNWVGNLQQLEQLTLTRLRNIGNDSDGHVNNEKVKWTFLNQASVEEFSQALSTGLPALKTLCLKGDIFSSTSVFHCCWAKFFPNLNNLGLYNLDYTTNDIIAELTTLDSLSELYLVGMHKLEDIAFTADCVDRNSESDSSSSSGLALSSVSVVRRPAITCFKSLAYLEIYNCSLLTNDCVINGIAKCKTLDSFKFSSCKNITEKCLECFECKAVLVNCSVKEQIKHLKLFSNLI